MEIYFIILIAVQGIIDIFLFRHVFTHDGWFLGILKLLKEMNESNYALYQKITKKEK